MSSTKAGGAHNTFSEARDWQGKTFEASLRQATMGYSIDGFIKQFSVPFPNHIKIDVDGIEGSIIEGGSSTLKDSRLKSMLVELDSGRKEHTGKIINILDNAGLPLLKKEHAPMLDVGKYKNCYNYIFARHK